MTIAYEIGPFRLDREARVVTQDGVPVALGSRAVAVLAALVEKANEHVPKAAIIDAAWPGLVVEEGNLAVQISAIRKVFARVPGGDEWVETLARRGYRFVGPVVALPQEDSLAEGFPRGSLPRPLTSFIGRDASLEALRGLLGGARLLTISGAGGIGKTRLALQLAEEKVAAYRDGAWFVDLALLAHGALVPSAIAQALELRETPARPFLASLCAQLAAREMLIVLDNCEHVLDAAAAAAETLLRECGGLTILATSREPLHVAGEQVYALEPLSLPGSDGGVDAVLQSEAGRLFMDRLRRQQPRFELTSEAASLVARLCSRLDGIPLALELAAARGRSLSLEQIDAHLGDRFRLLTEGSRTALPRQKTLRATLDWSHELLGEDERIVLRRCAVFAAGFTLEAAQAVAGEPAAGARTVADVLALLSTRSLLSAGTRSGTTRYGMLETTRAYALEQLEASGEAASIRRRQALQCRDAMARACDDWMLLSDAAWSDAYATELDNVRAALDWAVSDDTSVAIALAGASGPLWTTLNLRAEGIERLRAAIDLGAADDACADRNQLAARARLWLWFGVLSEGEIVEALAAYEHAVALYRELGDTGGLGMALSRQGRMLAAMGRFEAAEIALADSFARLRVSSTPKVMGFYWGNVGYLRMCRGDTAGARTSFEKAMELHRAGGTESSAMVTLANLANVSWALGDLQACADAFRRNIEMIKRSTGARRSVLGASLCNLAGVLVEMGELEEALAAGRKGLPPLRESGFAWISMDHFALLAVLDGRIEDGARLSGYADAAFAKRRMPRQANEARAFERLRRLLGDGLAADKLDQLRRQGAELTEELACRLAAGQDVSCT